MLESYLKSKSGLALPLSSSGPVALLLTRLTLTACKVTEGVVFNGAGFDRDLMKGIWFDHWRRRGSDTVWMREVLRRAGKKVEIVKDILLSLWLCRDRNLSNPARARRFTYGLDKVRHAVGPAAWSNSDEQLDAL